MRLFLVCSAVVIGLTVMLLAHAQDTLPPAGQSPQGQAGQAGGRPGSQPAAPADAATMRQQISYGLGRNFAQNLRQNEIEVDLESLLAGVSDTLRDAPPRWSEEQLNASLQRFGQQMQQKAQARMQGQAEKNAKEAEAFLAQNAQREGVQTTASGLQYRVLQEGNGPSPTLNDTVRCNYRGMLLNGTEFDSSAQHGGPAEFPVRGVIPGWTEALQKMKVGGKWQLFVPPNLAYGAQPPGPPIEPNSLLVFEIELLEIVN
jgi:FKBP-type peptidyl-prolyl cis-trans isomerase FklB